MNPIEVLREARALLQEDAEELGPCDHSVNVCVCGIKNAVANLDALIADYERAEPAAAHYFNVYGDRVEAPPQSHKGNTMSNERAPLTDYDIDLLCQAEMGAPAGNFDLAFARVIEREVLARASAAPQEPGQDIAHQIARFVAMQGALSGDKMLISIADEIVRHFAASQPQASPQAPSTTSDDVRDFAGLAACATCGQDMTGSDAAEITRLQAALADARDKALCDAVRVLNDIRCGNPKVWPLATRNRGGRNGRNR